MDILVQFVMYEIHSLIMPAIGGLWALVQNIVEFIFIFIRISRGIARRVKV
jgi:hypothetical protein